MTGKQTTVSSVSFKPGGPLPTAWEAHAHMVFEQLAGLRGERSAGSLEIELGNNPTVWALRENVSLMVFHWAQVTTLEGRADVPVAESYRDAAELAARVVETVRPFLAARGLLGDPVRGERKAWAEDDKGELVYSEGPVEVERLRLDRFFGPADAEGRRVARLETVKVDGKPHELLAFDVVLAELLEELDSPKWASDVRGTPAEERGRRWTDLEKFEPRAALTVCKAVWKRIQAERERTAKEAAAVEERRHKVPVPSLHAMTAAVTLGLGRQLNTPVLRGTAAGIVAPPEPGWWAQFSETGGDTAGVLAAWLTTRGHVQWLAGGLEMADRVEVVASKEQLAAMGLVGARGSPAAELEAALELLANVRLMGGDDDSQPGSGRLVLDYFKTDKRLTTAKGGRPSSVYVVTLGWPLMPTRLEALAAERGFTIPRELAWYGPVLNPAWAPLTGNARTARTQRLAYAVGFGQWIVNRREEYAELGGLRLDTLRPFLQSMGLYHRSHASLADDVAVQWRTAPKQPQLPELGPKGPLLVPTLMDGVYKLGPDYKAQEALVLRNAELTEKARRAQKKGKRKP